MIYEIEFGVVSKLLLDARLKDGHPPRNLKQAQALIKLKLKNKNNIKEKSASAPLDSRETFSATKY